MIYLRTVGETRGVFMAFAASSGDQHRPPRAADPRQAGASSARRRLRARPRSLSTTLVITRAWRGAAHGPGAGDGNRFITPPSRRYARPSGPSGVIG